MANQSSRISRAKKGRKDKKCRSALSVFVLSDPLPEALHEQSSPPRQPPPPTAGILGRSRAWCGYARQASPGCSNHRYNLTPPTSPSSDDKISSSRLQVALILPERQTSLSANYCKHSRILSNELAGQGNRRGDTFCQRLDYRQGVHEEVYPDAVTPGAGTSLLHS